MLPISERNARTIDTQINFTSTMKNLDTTYSEFFFFLFCSSNMGRMCDLHNMQLRRCRTFTKELQASLVGC